jgi:hypothetical protein
LGRTKLIEASECLVLGCKGCGELLLLLGREDDWYGGEGRRRTFRCSGCGEQLTLADRIILAAGVSRR